MKNLKIHYSSKKKGEIKMFNLSEFIYTEVVQRAGSMFLPDIEKNKLILSEKIENKTVLVIGGAGSIGSSFIKALLPFKPKSLVVVDINENALAELTRDLRSTKDMFIPENYLPYPMDYSSSVFKKMFRKQKGFDIVANFSAHKHVRSEKDIYSIEALLQNNIINAKYLLDLIAEFPPEEYFCVSTDKAANPVNIMGASKRIMEDIIFSYSDKFPVKTARFANVAFSNGSLPAGFMTRISKLQPLSAPLDVKRYFVSPEESGQICLLSCFLAKNREILFPKLEKKQMMSFDSIALKLLNRLGYKPLICDSEDEAIEKSIDLLNGSLKYPVLFSKINTSGEKEYEEFFTNNESINMNKFLSLGTIIDKEIPNYKVIENFIDGLVDLLSKDDINKNDIVKIIKGYLPNFQHVEKGKSLDSKM